MIQLEEPILQELCYFADFNEEFSESSLEQLLNFESYFVLLKESQKTEIENIDDAILRMIYGDMKHPPGDYDCVARRLITIEEETEERPAIEEIGIWVPPTPQLRATALKLFFTKITKEFQIPEPEPEPEHVAIMFSIHRKDKIHPLMNEFQNDIMRRGYFTSENPDEAQLVAKTQKELEKLDTSQRTYSEIIVLQVSKKKSEAVFAFAQLEPLYMSPNAQEGKIECQKFFPEGYDEKEEEEEEVEEEEEEAEEKIERADMEEENVEEELQPMIEETEGEPMEADEGVIDEGETIKEENVEQVEETPIEVGEATIAEPEADVKIEEAPELPPQEIE